MELEYMAGSTNNNDYIVLGEVSSMKVGIKPVLELASGTGIENPIIVATGYRLRVIPSGNVASIGHMAKTTFPEYNFQKIDSNRASAYMMAALPLFPPDMPFSVFHKGLVTGGFFESLFEFLDHAYDIVASPNVDKEDFIDITLKVFEDEFVKVCAKIAELNPDYVPVEEVSKKEIKAKVIELKPKKD